MEWNEKQCSASLLGIYLDQVRDASYRVNQIVVASVNKDESKTLHSSVVSPVGFWNYSVLLSCWCLEICRLDSLLSDWLHVCPSSFQIQRSELSCSPVSGFGLQLYECGSTN